MGLVLVQERQKRHLRRGEESGRNGGQGPNQGVVTDPRSCAPDRGDPKSRAFKAVSFSHYKAASAPKHIPKSRAGLVATTAGAKLHAMVP